MAQHEIHDIRGIVVTIAAARRATSWPWKATCGGCGSVSLSPPPASAPSATRADGLRAMCTSATR